MEVKTHCDRCGGKLSSMKMSILNIDMLCPKCIERERNHLRFREAKKAEAEEVKNGNYNYKGLLYDEKPSVFTSYFAKHKVEKYENAISIARKTPEGIRTYEPLFPPEHLLRKIKSGKIDWDEYTQIYYAEVLDFLDPKKVLEDLGENPVLLCYEKSGDDCHRYIVSEWLENKLGIMCKEKES